MRKFVCLLLPLAMFISFSACQDNSGNVDVPPVEQHQLDEYPQGRSSVLPLYFYNKDGKKLVLEQRDILMDGSESRAAAAIEQLLAGPADVDGQLDSIFPVENVDEGMRVRLDSVQVSGKVANVDLYSESKISDNSTMVKARTAVANTLIELLGVDQVNLFMNGSALAVDGLLLGSMERHEGGPDEYLRQKQQESEKPNYPMQIKATLYFPDITGQYLICEARTIEISDASYGAYLAILNELLKGPRDVENLQGVATSLEWQRVASDNRPYDIRFKMMEQAGVDGSGEAVVNETQQPGETPAVSPGPASVSQPNLSWHITLTVYGQKSVEGLSEAAVVCSLLATMPNLQGVSVSFEQEDTGQTYKNRRDYDESVGTLLTMYFAHGSGNTLGTQQCALAQRDGELVQAVLFRLLQGPREGGSLRNVLSSCLREEDILSAYLSEKVAVVNLSDSFYQAAQSLSSEEARLVVYSIVNTLTEIPGVNAVQFLNQGVSPGDVGQLVLGVPLMQNPGMCD